MEMILAGEIQIGEEVGLEKCHEKVEAKGK